MPQIRKESEPLTERIGVRVTAGEKTRLREDAALASLSVSELVRRRYFGRPIMARTDQAMVRELRRLGGLLKLARHESDGTQSQQTAEVLRAVVAAIERLGHDRQKD
ncbi:MAG: MobB mobilization protein [Candidatus Competibacter sp.]